MKKLIQIIILSFVVLSGCSSDADNYGVQHQPILNGTRVTGDDHLAIVGLVQELNFDDYAAFCTGTLISPEYVLTAAHCVTDCDDGSEPVENARWRMRVGVGQSVLTYRKVVAISEYHIHPGYVCKGEDLLNDIAVLKLAEPVPLEVAPNALPMGKKLDLTADDIDSEAGITVSIFGFGRTGADNPLSTGSKYVIQSRILARCPSDGALSAHCNEAKTKQKGMLYFDASDGGTCQGDSGGPAIWTHKGLEFVVGVTSYGYEDCKFVNADALVSEYETFISQFVPVLQAWPEEICGNEKDDDGDGLADCDDDGCKEFEECKTAIEIPDPPVTDPVDNPKDPDNGEIDPKPTPDSGSGKSGCSMNEPLSMPLWALIFLGGLIGMAVTGRKRKAG